MKKFRGVSRDFLLTHTWQSKFVPSVFGEWEAVLTQRRCVIGSQQTEVPHPSCVTLGESSILWKLQFYLLSLV